MPSNKSSGKSKKSTAQTSASISNNQEKIGNISGNSGVTPLDVVIVGGGMITNDLILPSIYHLQRLGMIGSITITALNNPPLKALLNNPDFS